MYNKASFLKSMEVSLSFLEDLEQEDRVEVINQLREWIHGYSPFKGNPVDFVKWVKNTEVMANDYNPNAVAPPEMKLLEHSIDHDGYTQPIVAWEKEEEIEVIDGFHRHRVGKESKSVQTKVHGYLPIVAIKDDCQGRNDRIASTIRHNRARGKHKVESMSDIVLELKRRNWSPKKIGKELGMDQDEVLRLVQITGVAEMFKDKEFSEAWEVGDYEEVEEIGQ